MSAPGLSFEHAIECRPRRDAARRAGGGDHHRGRAAGRGDRGWLRLVAEFDRRGGWHGVGIRSCAHWLAWQCGLGSGAAREHVRVARALPGLPRIQAAFSAGRLSYSKVRALTRIAAPDCEAALAGVRPVRDRLADRALLPPVAPRRRRGRRGLADDRGGPAVLRALVRRRRLPHAQDPHAGRRGRGPHGEDRGPRRNATPAASAPRRRGPRGRHADDPGGRRQGRPRRRASAAPRTPRSDASASAPLPAASPPWATWSSPAPPWTAAPATHRVARSSSTSTPRSSPTTPPPAGRTSRAARHHRRPGAADPLRGDRRRDAREGPRAAGGGPAQTPRHQGAVAGPAAPRRGLRPARLPRDPGRAPARPPHAPLALRRAHRHRQPRAPLRRRPRAGPRARPGAEPARRPAVVTAPDGWRVWGTADAAFVTGLDGARTPSGRRRRPAFAGVHPIDTSVGRRPPRRPGRRTARTVPADSAAVTPMPRPAAERGSARRTARPGPVGPRRPSPAISGRGPAVRGGRGRALDRVLFPDGAPPPPVPAGRPTSGSTCAGRSPS